MRTQTAWRREVVYVDSDIPVNPWPSEFRIRRYKLLPIETTRPSWDIPACPIGSYNDVLMPVKEPGEPAEISAISVRTTAQPGVRTFRKSNGEAYELEILNRELPKQRAFPFYSEVNSFDCLRAYHTKGKEELTQDPPFKLQGRVTRHAIALARSFGIEPMKQAQHWFDNQTDDEARVKELFDEHLNGYAALVLDGAIAAPIIFCGQISRDGIDRRPNKLFLQKINNLAPAGSMALCADEPSADGMGNGMPISEAIERVRWVQAHAPRLIPMITTGIPVLRKLQTLAPDLPIRYVIVQNHDSDTVLNGQKGSYFSCMAQGCEANNPPVADPNKPPKKRTDYPVAVVEGNSDSDFKGSIRLAYNNKAIFALYYKITLKLTTCWKEGELWNEGGNGDGTAMYIHPHTGLTIPSIRMKYWHEEQQKIEKEMLS